MENYLKITVTRNYGTAGTVTFELSHGKAIAHDMGLVESNLMFDQMENIIESFEINRLPHLRPAPQANGNTITVLAEKIAVNMKDGKRMYNVICGEWREHGVPFYEEHMKDCGINPKNVPDEGHIFKEGTKAILEMRGDKPRRVLKLVKA